VADLPLPVEHPRVSFSLAYSLVAARREPGFGSIAESTRFLPRNDDSEYSTSGHAAAYPGILEQCITKRPAFDEAPFAYVCILYTRCNARATIDGGQRIHKNRKKKKNVCTEFVRV
jgi:hypothetical protein